MSIILPAPAPLLAGDLERACLERTGPLRAVEPLKGGNVSRVFRLTGARGTVVVKIRGTAFARIPELVTTPDLVQVEARALAIFGSRLPDTFPEVLAVAPAQGVLVLTDLGTDSVSLQDRWAAAPPTHSDLVSLADIAATLLLALAPASEVIRAEGDRPVQDHLLGYCLRTFGHPVLDQAADACAAEPPQLVHGDLCPKNVLVTRNRLRLCDLDSAHRGSALFEVGYLLAHVLLHLTGTEDLMQDSLAEFQRACLAAGLPFDTTDPLLAAVITGILLYRLTSKLVPYPLRLTSTQRATARDRLFRLLDTGLASVPQLCHALAANTDTRGALP